MIGQATRPAEEQASLLACCLVIYATMFNGLLAIINAQFVNLSPNVVILAEIIFMGGTFMLAYLHFRSEMTIWLVLLILMAVIAALRAVLYGEVNIRYFRDVAIVPTGIILGMLCMDKHLNKTVIVIHAVIIVFMLLEAVDTASYSKLFDIQKYYINTRGYDDDSFWNKGSELFVSAVRPQERIFLPGVDLHRLSSIFLEPVSLGNYCVVITAFIVARFSVLSRASFIFLAVGNMAVMVGCDGRLALASSLLVIGMGFIARWLPRGIAVLYLPLTLLACFAVTEIGGYRAGPDDFAGRVAHTVELLAQYDLIEFLGLSERYFWQAADSGIAYMIMSQSIIGVCIIWCYIAWCGVERNLQQSRYIHAVCIYLSFAMMISFSVFTVKTAALLWFVYGAFQRLPVTGSVRSGAGMPAGAMAEHARR